MKFFIFFCFAHCIDPPNLSFKVLTLFELFRIVIKMPPLYPRTSLSNNKSTDLNKGHLTKIFSRHSYGIYSVTSLRTCKAYPEGENSSFVFTCLNCSTLLFSACLGSSSSDNEKTFRNPLLKLDKWPLFFIYSHFQLTMKVGLSIQLNCRPTL